MCANSRVCPYREEVSPPTFPSYALECERGGEPCWIKGMRVIPLEEQSQQNGSSRVGSTQLRNCVTVLLLHSWELVKHPACCSRAIMAPYLRRRQESLPKRRPFLSVLWISQHSSSYLRCNKLTVEHSSHTSLAS